MEELQQAATRLRAARSVTAITGAGVSAASGVPTFRGPGGLWRSYRPEDLATPEAFSRDPRLVWQWYDWRRSVISGCDPNPAHHVLARWTSGGGFTLITQNVDGLHERAMATMEADNTTGDDSLRAVESDHSTGSEPPRASSSEGAGRASRHVIRMHGSIWELRCTGPCGRVWEDRTVPLPALPPHCPRCRGLVRPNVVWFGEPLDPAVLAACGRALDCDVFLSIGTSSVVHPAAGLVHEAKGRGAFTIEINPAATDATGTVDLAIAMAAEAALPLIDELRTRSS